MKKLNLFTLGLISISLASCGGEKTEETKEVVLETLKLDTKLSTITWVGEYMKGGAFDHSHEGTVVFNSGSVEVADGLIKSGSFELDMNSIYETNAPMGEELRVDFVEHMKSDEYFDVKKFPTATVTLTECTKDQINGTMKVKGIEMPFKAPVTIESDSTSMKISGDFSLSFEPFKIQGIGKGNEPEYVSPNVKFNIGLKLNK
jgi:polyisoprenoid-binding protein YceI